MGQPQSFLGSGFFSHEIEIRLPEFNSQLLRVNHLSIYLETFYLYLNK